jgi:hypothetical protein
VVLDVTGVRDVAGVSARERVRRSELATTSTELAAIAAPATIGLSSPNAATGMPRVL